MRGPGRIGVITAAAGALALAGCGQQTRRHARAAITSSPAAPAPVRRAAKEPGPLQALVTAQTENRLLVVDLPSGRVVKQVTVPGDPEYVATSPTAACSIAVVVSAASGTVTLLDSPSLRPIKVFRGFVSPHIPAIFPDTEHVYVTDDASGKLTVIGLYNHRVLARVAVGVGAHHLAFSPDWRQVWVALGQSARTITVLSTLVSTPPPPASPVGNPGRPHVIGHFDPGFLAHDLRFTADDQRVWITSASTSFVGVFSAHSHRLLFRVPGGPPPQHVVFDGGFAYITSGYGSRIEKARLSDGQVVARAHAPYGSFDLDAAGGYIVTSSLLRGTLAIFNRQLRLLHVRHLAPSTEDVSICRR
jgi:DNA-binding beta-propeller fold protein YncE